MNLANLSPIVLRARGFAVWAHGDQWYGNHPYVHHLDDVAEVVREFGGDEELQVAAYLHDVVEDCLVFLVHADFRTDLTHYYVAQAIRVLFGEAVAKLVFAVTNEPGANRRERHAATYPKTFKAGPRALFLKLCDRIANMRASVGHSKAQMYIKEYREFKLVLYTPDHETLWSECDRLVKVLAEVDSMED